MNVDKDEILRVSRTLALEYGTPDLGNLPDPLEELIYIVMSTMTTSHVHKRTFLSLKARFPEWEMVLAYPVEALIEVIKPAGLSEQKGLRIYEILRKIQGDYNKISLDFLIGIDPEEAEKYLLSLPGVGKKVARCVMIYSLGMDAFPVDAHVLRICKRLGWIETNLSWRKGHDVLQLDFIHSVDKKGRAS